jgi:acyl carrier protein
VSVDTIQEQLQLVFQGVFAREDLAVTADTTAFDIEEWDSLMHINLVIAIEERFSVRFTVPELTGLQTVGDMMQLIRRKKPA